MPQATITEAMAELKVINKRLMSKREFIARYLVTPQQLKDPLESEGGSAKKIAEELQAIGDLETNVVNIHRAITQANSTTELTVGGRTMPIADWLCWRRDVAPGRQSFIRALSVGIQQNRAKAQQAGHATVDTTATGAPAQGDLIVNLSEADLGRQSEELEATLEGLDGQLSLKNATTTVSW